MTGLFTMIVDLIKDEVYSDLKWCTPRPGAACGNAKNPDLFAQGFQGFSR
jgi:hypothetical protein